MHAIRRFCVCSQARLGLALLHQPHPRSQAKFALLKQQPAPRVVTLLSFSSKAPAGGMDDLADKQCLPCNSKEIWAMPEHSARELLEKSELGIHGWDLVSDGGTLKLHRSWKVKSFTEGLEFFKLVADVAEAEARKLLPPSMPVALATSPRRRCPRGRLAVGPPSPSPLHRTPQAAGTTPASFCQSPPSSASARLTPARRLPGLQVRVLLPCKSVPHQLDLIPNDIREIRDMLVAIMQKTDCAADPILDVKWHHPDLHLVGWNNIKIDLWTHSVGGLTENDFILAAKINTLHVEHLLRRKAAD
ncbi:hypothetical protein Taro_043580 [Colocasia esculenta]|uniref:4a-hydroxytetrahydrobiopterin dehydratase n=1 Tax=Colocasia esculenta TaxID=4460 RepID=A0A843WJS6_COLES|nr:hypothetical protein [Colocasia esculenta]